ncbi:MAG: type II toxin-antitoxin system VapC family toxin [Deltaproteobacteria bacterium]|nr:type II toxin-antitoxin system VapC family toxin [Deltaproteobacteria bacterium]MBI3390180.1 type II toxin-antitoxin system VapC family toxin [Deltaproteobacteria bacterium]
MNYLLDTHAWLWGVLGDARLGRQARRAVASAAERTKIGLAAISLKEAAWLLAHQRIVLSAQASAWPDWLRAAASAPGLEVLPLTVEIAIASEQLPASFPKDPADRLIVATARRHGLTLITADSALRGQAHVPTLW